MEIRAIGTRGAGGNPPLKVLAVLETKHSGSKGLAPPPPIFSDLPKSLDLKLGQPTFYDQRGYATLTIWQKKVCIVYIARPFFLKWRCLLVCMQWATDYILFICRWLNGIIYLANFEHNKSFDSVDVYLEFKLQYICQGASHFLRLQGIKVY